MGKAENDDLGGTCRRKAISTPIDAKGKLFPLPATVLLATMLGQGR